SREDVAPFRSLRRGTAQKTRICRRVKTGRNSGVLVLEARENRDAIDERLQGGQRLRQLVNASFGAGSPLLLPFGRVAVITHSNVDNAETADRIGRRTRLGGESRGHPAPEWQAPPRAA